MMYNIVELKILKHPLSHSYDYDDHVSLSVVAVGSQPLRYWWKKNRQHISDTKHYSGMNTPSLTIMSFLPEHQGGYTCVVSDGQVSRESDLADLKLSKYN